MRHRKDFSLKNRVLTLVALALAASLLPATSASAAPRSRATAYWTQAGVGPVRVNTGYLIFRPDGAHFDSISSIDSNGIPVAPMWKPDGLAISWYETGRENFEEVRYEEDPDAQDQFHTGQASPDLVMDRSSWIRGRRPIVMLKEGNREGWYSVPATNTPVQRAKITHNGRDISKFVTSVTSHPGSGGVASVRPYTISNNKRVYGKAYLARINSALEVTERLGRFPGARAMAISAGGSRLAYLNMAQNRVRVLSLPNLGSIASYPGVAKARLSFAPNGVLAISNNSRVILRSANGQSIQVATPGANANLVFGPCTGSGCNSLA
jgi:hypothetical protein